MAQVAYKHDFQVNFFSNFLMRLILKMTKLRHLCHPHQNPYGHWVESRSGDNAGWRIPPFSPHGTPEHGIFHGSTAWRWSGKRSNGNKLNA